MAHDLKFSVVLLTLSVSLAISLKTQPGLEYFFYSPLGQKSSEEFIIRVKRDDSNPISTTTTSTNSTTTTTILSTILSQNSTEDSSKNRGWQPPENQTTILKNVDLKEGKINETIKAKIEEEGFKGKDDYFKYYKNVTIPFNNTWIDLEEWNKTTHPGIVYQHSMLSKSYRRAATISLKFKFPFYGHMVENITIATGGFLYTGDYVHSWLAATQYIAPLMANFDTSQMDNATVTYADNGTTLVVEWGNVYLQGREGAKMEGPFTFQAILHKNGDIVFAYKNIPISITGIADEEHPVKVGLSDAYIIERTIFFVRRKTIYEYHRVDMKDKEIANYTAIKLKALPRCNMQFTCNQCLDLAEEYEDGQQVKCKWCESAKPCSDGYDRNKQNWLKNNCDKKPNHVEGNVDLCQSEAVINHGSNRNNPSYTFDDHLNDHSHEQQSESEELGHDQDSEHFKDSKSNVHHTGVALLTIVIILIITICGWCLYAYFFPHTCSGQLLIKYRPSRWHWRRGEPRYTAASIHM